MVSTMTIDHGAGNGARNPNLPANWSDTLNLMNEVLARAHCTEWYGVEHRHWNQREHEFARQVAVARAQRSARWAERFAALANRRAKSRRERANRLSVSLR